MVEINMKSSLFCVQILLLCVLMSGEATQPLLCSVVNCGQGTCVSSNTSVLGFDCECNPGWKNLEIGSFRFPSCFLPNCTVDLSCSNETFPPPPPPSTLFSPIPNNDSSDPCNMVWCGDGNCAGSGNGHTCNCFPGAANLFGNTAFACFKQCSFGADCGGLGLGLTNSPPTPSPSKSNGPTQAVNNSSKLGMLSIMLLVAATIHTTWF